MPLFSPFLLHRRRCTISSYTRALPRVSPASSFSPFLPPLLHRRRCTHTHTHTCGLCPTPPLSPSLRPAPIHFRPPAPVPLITLSFLLSLPSPLPLDLSWSAEQQRAAQGKATKVLEEAEDLVRRIACRVSLLPTFFSFANRNPLRCSARCMTWRRKCGMRRPPSAPT